jgi:hypothetical protein
LIALDAEYRDVVVFVDQGSGIADVGTNVDGCGLGVLAKHGSTDFTQRNIVPIPALPNCVDLVISRR